jgi:hypothetical protein
MRGRMEKGGQRGKGGGKKRHTIAMGVIRTAAARMSQIWPLPNSLYQNRENMRGADYA